MLILLLPMVPWNEQVGGNAYGYVVKLPEPRTRGEISVEEALRARRSVREYRNELITADDISQLLWAAQGITGPRGERTAPSAGALYPLEVYVLMGRVVNFPSGIYKYKPQGHELVMIAEGDIRAELSDAALHQPWIKESAAVIVFSAVYARTEKKYGKRASRYVPMEVGHSAQNVYLQAVSLRLGTVFVGAFDDLKVKKLMHMESGEQPLGLMPVGKI